MSQKRGRPITQASNDLKAEIKRLREEGKKMDEIGQALGVTKQYVSLVLKQGVKNWIPRAQKPRRRKIDKALRRKRQATISRLEKRGELELANRLRIIEQRRREKEEQGES